MAQLSDDCFAFGGALLTVEAALAQLEDRIVPVTRVETVSLDAALGRVLAEDVVASRAVPPHDNSAVDGYAVFHDDLSPTEPTRLAVAGRVAAGHPTDRPVARGTAVRIFTGAPVPAGLDTVFMQEDCREEDGMVVLAAGLPRGANYRRAGEDVAVGTTALVAGRRLRPQDIGMAASLGCRTLQVHRALRVALFSTGDEVREPGDPAGPGCIYDSNRHMLSALLRQLGCAVTDLGILADSAGTIAQALRTAAEDHDLILTSGGVSTGEEDHVKGAVETAGGRLHAWRLAIKPGRPVALGQIGAVPFVGLPGNPVAVLVTFIHLARPILLRLAGAEPDPPRRFPVHLGFDYKKKQGRREYVRVTLETAADGILVATKVPGEGAAILSSLVKAEGLVELGEDSTRVAAGAVVGFLPFGFG